jgi:hypothetical protein
VPLPRRCFNPFRDPLELAVGAGPAPIAEKGSAKLHRLRPKHGNGRAAPGKAIRHRYCDGGSWPHDGDVKIYNPAAVRTTRYRYRGTTIPSP